MMLKTIQIKKKHWCKLLFRIYVFSIAQACLVESCKLLSVSFLPHTFNLCFSLPLWKHIFFHSCCASPPSSRHKERSELLFFSFTTTVILRHSFPDQQIIPAKGSTCTVTCVELSLPWGLQLQALLLVRQLITRPRTSRQRGPVSIKQHVDTHVSLPRYRPGTPNHLLVSAGGDHEQSNLWGRLWQQIEFIH